MVPAAEVGLVKSVYVGAAPAVKAVAVPASAAPAQGTSQAGATVDTIATVGE